jgi:hypothetical protein
MYARLLAILAVVVVMGACTAAEGSPTTTTTTGSPTTTQPAAEVEDGDQFALVNDVTAGVVTLDPAMLLTGDAAVEAARADGVIGPDEDLPNDFYISNPVKESLQVPIRMDATCRLYGFDSEGALMDVEVDVATLAGLFAGTVDASAYYGFVPDLYPMHLTVTSGEITRAEALYVP